MTSQTATRRRSRSGAFLIASFAALASLTPLTAAPAHAQVDPGYLPVTGTWSRGDVDTVAWIDLATWRVATFSGDNHPSLDPEPQPWRPVAGDWDGDGVDTIQMFNVRTWRVVPAEVGPSGDTQGPEPQPWIPVAGDWNGDGIDTILVFDERDASVRSLGEGPIRVDRYDPQPQPWRPAVGDWEGRGIDTVTGIRDVVSTPVAAPVWMTLIGDWDGDRIDSAAGLYLPTGELVQAGAEAGDSATASPVSSAFAEALQLPNGCYVTIKNKTTAVFTTPYPSKCTYETTMWEQWTCCPYTTTGGHYSCSVVTKSSVKQSC